jgi:BolA protein
LTADNFAAGEFALGDIARIIEAKLMAALEPTVLTVADDSAQHSGHSGARPGGESHFTVTVESRAFTGLGRLARHRLVNRLLAEELAGPVHALALITRAPNEA